jgi:hypothetical protein
VQVRVLLGAFCYLVAYVGPEVYLLVRRNGQTPGTGLMGLRIVPADAGSELRAPGTGSASGCALKARRLR